MTVKRKGNKFFLEVFIPEQGWKYQGKTIEDKNGIPVFVTHLKKPLKHFYIKGQGYPINIELLEKLRNARIRHILIPEKGKTGYHCYLARVKQYLKGEQIEEPLTEPQKAVPLKNLEKLELTESQIRNML